MAFSFADLGFWRLVVVTVVLELLHGILESHWPAIRGSRLGQRSLSALLFMGLEALSLIVTVAAAIGTLSRMLRSSPRPAGQIVLVLATALTLCGMFLFLWQS